MNRINRFFLQFNEWVNGRFWVLTGGLFLLKLFYLYYYYTLTLCKNPEAIIQFLAVRGGDTRSYIYPVTYLIEHGAYISGNGFGEVVYAGRLPLYGLIYHSLNYLSLGHGYTALALFQLALSVLGIMLLIRMMYKINILTPLPFFLFICFFLSNSQTFWSMMILPESLAMSLILISVTLYKPKYAQRYPFVFGVILTGITLLKPYFGILFVVYSFFFLLVQPQKNKFKLVFKLWLPLILFIAPWTVRNYYHLGKLIPLTEEYSGYGYTKSEIEMRQLTSSMGLRWEPWDTKTFGYWMRNCSSNCKAPKLMQESTHYNEILIVRKEFQAFIVNINKPGVDDNKLEVKISKLRSELQNEFPFRTKIASPFFITSKALLHSGSWFYPVSFRDSRCGSILANTDKAIQTALYYFGMISYIPFLLFLWRRHERELFYFSLFIPVFIIGFFCFGFKVAQYRYFIQIYPLFVIAGAFMFSSILVHSMNGDFIFNWKRKD